MKNLLQALCSLLVLSAPLQAQWFEDVTAQSGVSELNNSFGIAWSDVNGDGYSDVYLTNHWRTASLYVNQQDGTFINEEPLHDIAQGHVDAHGAAFGDYDNDGDDDLVVAVGGFTTGGGIPDTPYFDNIDGRLTLGDPNASGLNYAYSGRTPIWFDENNDGLLDLLMVSRPQAAGFYTGLLRQVSKGQFTEVSQQVGLGGVFAASAQLLPGPNAPQIPDLVFNTGQYYRWNGNQWQNVASSVLGVTGTFADALQGDVNGDGLIDLYWVREGTRKQLVTEADRFKLAYQTTPDVPGVIDIKTPGTLTIIRSLNLGTSAFRIGANNVRPTLATSDDPLVLDPNDPDVLGVPDTTLQTALRVFVWYTPADTTWHLRIGSANSGRLVDMEVLASTAFQDLVISDIDLNETLLPNRLYINDGNGGYTIQGGSGITDLLPTHHGAFGDFDNDMDLDLYIVNRSAVGNVQNQLFENQGDGTFVEVADAGAPGADVGVGDSVAVSDYDNDGFLDLFVTNGKSDIILLPYPGPNTLYHNIGNSNHWVEIDLQGTRSNRNGIGALVEVEAGGKTQVRYQANGNHAFTQDDPRLHFGLGPNTRIDRLTVKWPSGVEQTVRGISADQIMQIIEPQPELAPGQMLGLPFVDDSVSIWKDTFDGAWHLRGTRTAAADPVGVKLISDSHILQLDNIDTPALASLQSGPYDLDLRFAPDSNTGGIDLQLASGTRAMLSVSGVDPDAIRIGPDAWSPALTGWIFQDSQIPALPAYTPKADLGLFFGNDGTAGSVPFVFNGDGLFHNAAVSLFAGEPDRVLFGGTSLEGADALDMGFNWAHLTGGVAAGWDELDLMMNGPTSLGLLYEQDGLAQPSRVNRGETKNSIGLPNAFLLPAPSPDGLPQYNYKLEEQLFIWRDHTNRWRIRVTGGDLGFGMHYVGELISDQPAELVKTWNVEANDTIDTSDPRRVRFDLRTGPGFFDGLDVRFPAGARVVLYVDEAQTNAPDPIRIGRMRWPADRNVVELDNGSRGESVSSNLPVTGQDLVYAAGDDGDLGRGLAWPDPRFEALGDGTVRDRDTGLIWMQNAECFGAIDWQGAIQAVNALADGQCGLVDGSAPGDWRLPNLRELMGLVDFGEVQPALVNGHPFLSVGSTFYWSSSPVVNSTTLSWGVVMAGGNLERRARNTTNHPVNGGPQYAWAVKGSN